MSSSSVVCQGFQPGLEPDRLVEPRVLRLKACPPIYSFFQSPSPVSPCYDHHPEISTNSKVAGVGDGEKAKEMGSWSFLQCLSDKNKAENKAYVHSLIEPTSAKLSEKSLEMCTEGLGSETGNNVVENVEEISLLSLGTKREAPKTKDGEKMFSRKRVSRTRNFPPPIRSISGPGGVQVKPYREGGRLVLEAVNVTKSASCFHVERSEGRLRLCLLKDYCFNSGYESTNEPAREKKEEERERCGEVEEEEEGNKGIADKVGDRTGTGKSHGVSSRCKSGGGGGGIGSRGGGSGGGSGQKGLMNWETFVVAT